MEKTEKKKKKFGSCHSLESLFEDIAAKERFNRMDSGLS